MESNNFSSYAHLEDDCQSPPLDDVAEFMPFNNPLPTQTAQLAIMKYASDAKLTGVAKNQLLQLISYLTGSDMPWGSWKALENRLTIPVKFYRIYPCVCEKYINPKGVCVSCGQNYPDLGVLPFFIIFDVVDYIEYIYSSQYLFY
jgi:hypothetical protein